MSVQAPEPAPDKPRRPVPPWVWPVGAVALAFLLRLPGIAWGLPNALHHQSYHPDEYLLLTIVSGNIDLGAGRWDPGFYNYGSLWLYIMAIATKVAAGWGLAGSTADLHLACRVVAALLGSVTVGMTYAIGRRLAGHAAGVAAALALALAPGHVVHSRFHTVDVPATFFVTACLLLALRAHQEEEPRRAMGAAMWACVLAGLAASVKYNMGVALLAPAVAVGLRRWPLGVKAWLWVFGLAAAVLAFCVTTPGSIFHTEQFLHDLRFETQHVRNGHGLVFVDTAPGWIYHLGNMVEALGWGVPLIGIAGLALAFARRDRAVWTPLAFALPYYVMIAVPEVKFLRYVLPLAPVACALAGYALGAGVRRTLVESRWAVAAGAVLVLGAAGGTNYFVVTELMMGADPRDEAAQWMRKNARGASVGFPTVPWFYSPPLFPNTGLGFGEVGARARLAEMRKVTEFRLLYYQPPAGGLPEWDPRLLTDLRPQYVVYSSFEFEDRERIARHEPEKVEGYRAGMADLRREYDLTARFGYPLPMSHDMRYISPEILIWKRKPPTPDEAVGSEYFSPIPPSRPSGTVEGIQVPDASGLAAEYTSDPLAPLAGRGLG